METVIFCSFCDLFQAYKLFTKEVNFKMVGDNNLSLETDDQNSSSVAVCTALEQRFIFNSKVSRVLETLKCPSAPVSLFLFPLLLACLSGSDHPP